MNSSNSLGNILTRLQGLKNVSGRRVKPESEQFQGLEPVENDISGTAPKLPNFENFAPLSQNIPQEDLGGQLTSQSYDVRANSPPPPEEEEAGFFQKLGQSLGNFLNPPMNEEFKALQQQAQGNKSIAQTPPIETTQVDLQEGIPPVTASQEESGGNILNPPMNEEFMRLQKQAQEKNGPSKWLKDTFTPKVELSEQLSEKFPEVAAQHPKFTDPEQMRKYEDEKRNAMEHPWSISVFGATDDFASKPDLVDDFVTYTGIPFDEMQKEMTEKYEKVLSNLENGVNDDQAGYDEQEQRIKQRMLNNESTEADKFYIGMALLMPLLVGGLFGKEAGLGALAGGAKGFADILGKRTENVRKDEEMLADLNKQKSANTLKKGELELERIKIPEQVKKNLPKDEYEDLKGMRIYQFKDPKTGEVVAEGPEVLPDLYGDLKYANTPKKREELRKAASELEEEKASLEKSNKATSDIIRATSLMKDPGWFSKILAFSLSDKQDSKLKKIMIANAPDIFIDGRKQNSAVYINSRIELQKDAYRRNEQMKAFTQTVANHMSDLIDNPLFKGLSMEDLRDQVLLMRDRAQNYFVDRASAQGFLREPLESKFGKLNRDLYKGLNEKEEKKEIEKDKREMLERNKNG